MIDITKHTFVILSYELITHEVVKAKIIDIFLDKVIYIIVGISLYVFAMLLNHRSCCPKYSPEEKVILKLIKAGDKMTQLNGPDAGRTFYMDAIAQKNKLLPFTDIGGEILSKIEGIEQMITIGGSLKKKNRKQRCE